ncbi:protein of unknown function [Candidatus Promineifilum breve]|uniref:Uncharacterized protein n=1 Tax=Candidatus Promineifilum breve TaxID=1806508 RepID=A0A170PDC4_9CHLR|nr:protein of unknown function [Candidatus Promineifilum breve]
MTANSIADIKDSSKQLQVDDMGRVLCAGVSLSPIRFYITILPMGRPQVGLDQPDPEDGVSYGYSISSYNFC